MLSPVLEELAAEYGEKLKITKTDAHENSGVSVEYGIRSIPCLILFKDGKETTRMVGAQNKAQLKAWIDGKIEG